MQFSMANQPTYDPVAVQPMRDELIAVGFEEMLTADDVDHVLSNSNNETVLVMINSVCGCAAGSARPGVTLALQHKIIPNKLAAVFAGQDKESVAHLRDRYLGDFMPSSPFVALFKNGKIVFSLQRHEIEGTSAADVANRLKPVFDRYCSKDGPSINAEDYDKLVTAVACGSKIPKFSDN